MHSMAGICAQWLESVSDAVVNPANRCPQGLGSEPEVRGPTPGACYELTYRRGTLFEILQRISYGELFASRACSRASTLNPSRVPNNRTSSPTDTPGMPVTSTRVKSIEMLPRIGA